MPLDDEAISFLDQPIRLRALRATDRALLEDLVHRTDSHDLQMRFFSAFRRLPPHLLDELMRLDPERRIALIASRATSGGQAEILAVSRAYAVAEGSAELALLVRSDLKGLGLGSLMLARLIARCRGRGVKTLVADVLQANSRMLRLAGKYGFRRERAEPGVTRLVLNLT